ncbi:MAG: ribonuclease Y [Candidatus Omnitrophica bacterium]|nr:ribonuclease Y [Candidatus Omnitrophota bacterium]
MTYVGFGAIGAVFFFIFGYVIRKLVAKLKLKSAEDRAQVILDEVKREVVNKRKEVDLEAKDLLHRTRVEFDKESRERRQELTLLEKRLIQREENLDRKVDVLDRKEKSIEDRDRSLVGKEKKYESKQQELDRLLEEEKNKLQRISNMTKEEAKKILLNRLQNEVKHESELMIQKYAEETRSKSDKEARKIIGLAIQKCAAEHTVETTVSVVNLPSDDMKGRIIGREGRNIRALEIATGVDVIIDDTPEAVILSGFDIVKREIAKRSLEKLIADGRIHPGRIEEVVEKTKQEMDEHIKEEGEKAVFDVGIQSVHPEIMRLIGRLKYRTSYGQNVLQHSKEVAFLMGVLAGELKMDPTLARRIGMLHDIGKATSHEVEGTHASIGADLAKKYGESESVIHAIEAHHQDIEPRTLMAVLVQAADAISATRPGARRETLEAYIKRLEKLESLADSFKGVEKSFAIQAGREIRVIVQPDKITDAQAVSLAREITKKIEEGLEYPGQIKVTVIRETRAIEYAK